MKSEHLKTLLIRPLLPEDTRIRLRQQRYDEEAANRSRRILTTSGVRVTVTHAVDGAGTGDRAMPWSNGPAFWNGQKIVHPGWQGMATSLQWFPEPGGLLPGFDAAEVARAGVRPVSSGDCPASIAAIADVGIYGRHITRTYYLDAESRDLFHSVVCVRPEHERSHVTDVIGVAESAGIAYRRYGLTLAKPSLLSSLLTSPEKICEVLFPRSARRPRLGSYEEDWYSETPWAWRRW